MELMLRSSAMSNQFMHRLALQIFFSTLILCSTSVVIGLEQPQTAPTVSSIASRNFWQLNDALALYQNATTQPWPIIPDEPHILKQGMRDPLVPIIRER